MLLYLYRYTFTLHIHTCMHTYTLCPKNRARTLWPITFTNIDNYQCHLIELFLQHFLTIYHKKIIHTAATVVLATSALVQTNVCVITAHQPIVHVPPSSICGARPHLIWFLPTSGHLIAPTYPVDYRIWGCLQDPCLSDAHTSWNSTWLMYGQTLGRQSLTGPSISGESGFRPVSVWKDTISNMSCKSFLSLLTFLPSNFQVL